MDDTRSRILESALAVFAERGADGGSMREIARRAGVNVATTYHHFGSKRELLMATFRDLGFLDVPDFPSDWETDRETRDPVDVLEETIGFAWIFMHNGANVLRVLLAEALKGDLEVKEVFEAWRVQGDGFLQRRLLSLGLADEENCQSRAWTLRQVIWATFVEILVAGELDFDDLAPKARGAARSLLESWNA
jgi:AcrR family transcriptional regulator